MVPGRKVRDRPDRSLSFRRCAEDARIFSRKITAMGTAALRISDPTVHGGQIVVGFPTVLIGGMPASRVGDMHVCPMVTGVVPHIGGPLVTGAWTTLTGSSPQSRATDMLICVGPPDTALPGCPTVLVGMAGGGAGLGAMLMGLMLGLKDLVAGYPKAVYDPKTRQTVTQYNSSISVHGSPAYQGAVVADLNRFLARPTGQRWADRYTRTGRALTIRPINPSGQQDNGYTQSANANALVIQNADGTEAAGSGCDSTIQYNPSYVGSYTGEDGNTYQQQPYETLGHEMIHSLHNAEGTNRVMIADTFPNGDNQEEAQTIGVHGFDDNDVSERATSEDLRGVGSARPDHDSVTGGTYQDANGDWHQATYSTPGESTTSESIIPAPPGGPPNH